jgi:signal peptide peptidase SppA
MSLYEWGLSVPWCMTSAALDLMLALAAREEIDTDELKQAMHGPKSLALRDGRRRDDSATMTTVDGVARIVIDGPIYRYADYFTKYSGGVTTEALAKDVQKAIDDPAVAAIALVIDSPGGEATAINELADTIYAARGRKPIGAYIEGYGASAAYWIASAADVVVVDDNALVGSIGTVMGVLDPAKQVRRTIEFVSTQSPKKRVDPTTDDGRAYLQQLVDDMTEVFVGRVMRNRNLTREQVLAVGGGLLIGQQAIDAGLADRLGAEDQLMRELAAKAAERTPFLLPPARVPGGHPLRMEASMDWKTFWNGMFSAAAEVEGTPAAAAVEQAAPRTVQVGAEQLARAEAQAQSTDGRDAEMQALRERIAKQEAQQIAKDAALFADSAIRDRRAMPAERETLLRLYTAAAQDDARSPWPAPTDAGEAPSRVALLQADIATRPQHTLLEERVSVGAGGVLESGAKSEGLSEERRRQLLAMSPTGQAVLKARRATSA